MMLSAFATMEVCSSPVAVRTWPVPLVLPVHAKSTPNVCPIALASVALHHGLRGTLGLSLATSAVVMQRRTVFLQRFTRRRAAF